MIFKLIELNQFLVYENTQWVSMKGWTEPFLRATQIKVVHREETYWRKTRSYFDTISSSIFLFLYFQAKYGELTSPRSKEDWTLFLQKWWCRRPQSVQQSKLKLSKFEHRELQNKYLTMSTPHVRNELLINFKS